jgi:hypothetical protein
MKQNILEELAKDFYSDEEQLMERIAFKRGYMECEERMYSEENMINFAIWTFLEVGSNKGLERTNKELFQEWVKQRENK